MEGKSRERQDRRGRKKRRKEKAEEEQAEEQAGNRETEEKQTLGERIALTLLPPSCQASSTCSPGGRACAHSRPHLPPQRWGAKEGGETKPARAPNPGEKRL